MNVLVTTRKRLGNVFERKKGVKRPGEKSRLTDAKIESLQNYFSIALHQKAGDTDKMIFACKTSFFHVASCHKNRPKNQNS